MHPTRPTLSDDPVTRIVSRLRGRGWRVSVRFRNSKIAHAFAEHPAHPNLTVRVAPWAQGSKAQLRVRRDGVQHLPPLSGDGQEKYVCELLGIEPDDLWSSDVRKGKR